MDAKTDDRPTMPARLDLREVSAATPSMSDLLRRAIDRLALAVLVVDAEGEVITRNAGAERILAAGDGLCFRGRALSTARTADARALRSAIADAIADRGSTARSRHAVVTVARASGGTPLILLIAPLDTGAARPVALVLIGDLERPTPNYAQQLQVGFGLTHSETGVAVALMDGQRPKEIARRRGVRPSTVSTQMKAIFAKTGVACQSDLVKLISCLSSLAR